MVTFVPLTLGTLNPNVALICITNYEDMRKTVAFTRLMLDACCSEAEIPALAGILYAGRRSRL